MKIIKRDGSEAPFDRSKIERAIRGANSDVEPADRMAEELLVQLAVEIEERCLHLGHEPHVEEVQEMVEDAILAEGLTTLGKNYVRYRYVRQLARQANTTDASVLSILDCVNEEAKQENSNKDPKINSVQRDYMAGELSRDLTERLLLPPDIVEAHREGIIHFHDSDYYAQREHNCFAAETAILTMGGIRHFFELEDGVSVFVLDRHGKWREATVHSFGTQIVNEVTLESTIGSRKVVRVTANHRWLLASGDFTERLSVEDVLMDSPGHASGWHVAAIKPNVAEEEVWCVTEPVTHTFTLADYVVTGNCDLVNLNDMLQNGTVISETLIERPHSFATACNIATQIIAQVASNQYGGQSITLAHLAPFVDVSRKAIRADLESKNERLGLGLSKTQIDEMVEEDVRAEVKKGIQTIQYQLITLMTTNGQAPFLTVSMYLDEVPEGQIRDDLAMMIEETLLQRYEGVKNEAGAWITPAFPKLIYVLDEDNVRPGSKYFYLTQLAAKCTAKRLVPDYVSAKKMRELKLSKGEEPGEGDVYPPMGCRSFLTPDRSGNGFRNVSRALDWKPEPKYWGRFNQGVVTINLVDVALSSKGDEDAFWAILDERLELCHRALRLRHERLKGTLSDAAPILWQHGALARLDKGETIDKLLYGGYSTISLGYAGLYECVKYMMGVSHTEPEKGRPFGLAVMQALNDACTRWKMAEDIDYSVYGTPIESTTYKFAKCLQRRFGNIPGITDHGYITNSYHVCVREEIDAFTKLAFESDFQALSPGGAISYVEVPDMQDNLEAVIAVMQFIYDNIIYAELNTKSDYCQKCGYDGEIRIVEDDGKLVWECPKCGNRDQDTMNVARRTCGYIGTQYWNQGRTQEIAERTLHL